MTNSEAVQIIEVQLDIQEVQISANALVETLESLAKSFDTVAQWDMSGIVSDLAEMKENLDSISTLLSDKLDGSSWLTTLAEITSSGASLLGIFTEIAKEEVLLQYIEKLSTSIKGLGDISIDGSALFGGLSTGAILGIAAAIILVTTVMVRNFDLIKARFAEIWDKHIKPLWDNISASFASIGESLMSIWDGFLQPIINWIVSIFEPIVLTSIYKFIGMIEVLASYLSHFFGGIIVFLDGLLQFLSGIFTADLEKISSGIYKMLEGSFEAAAAQIIVLFNGIIWVLNIFLGALYSVIAGVVNAIGGVVTVIGNIVGEDWGFVLPTNPPKIPYLAKGAVLPANKPFLAMVGDQKHGTNVEAPLATIQEAVANVMVDMIPAMMAGFEAVVNEQRATRQAVESIELGDTVIGQAAARYSRKMAVIKGG